MGDDLLESEKWPPYFGHHDTIVVICKVVEGWKNILDYILITALQIVIKGASKGYKSW